MKLCLDGIIGDLGRRNEQCILQRQRQPGKQSKQSAQTTVKVWKVKRRMFLIKAVEAIERYGYWHGSTGSGISDASK